MISFEDLISIVIAAARLRWPRQRLAVAIIHAEGIVGGVIAQALDCGRAEHWSSLMLATETAGEGEPVLAGGLPGKAVRRVLADLELPDVLDRFNRVVKVGATPVLVIRGGSIQVRMVVFYGDKWVEL